MSKNVGRADRIVRWIVGLAIIGLGFAYGSWWGLVGIAFIGSAILSRCLVYRILGISTLKKDNGPAGGVSSESGA